MKTQPIDVARAEYEDKLVREHLPLVQYVVSEVAHRIPSHVCRSDLVLPRSEQLAVHVSIHSSVCPITVLRPLGPLAVPLD